MYLYLRPGELAALEWADVNRWDVPEGAVLIEM
jgi:integrase